MKSILLTFAAAYVLMVATSSGVLTGSQIMRLDGEGQDTLRCTYFTGFGFTETDFWHGAFGRDTCQRLVGLK